MRRKYLSDFRQDETGRYVYRGNVYVYAEDNTLERPAALRRLWLGGIVLFAAALVQGCLPADGMTNCTYVLIPYCAEVIAAGSAAWAVMQLGTAREGVREYAYAASVEVLPRRALLSSIFAAAALTGEGVYLALHGAGETTLVAAVIALMLLVCAAGLLLRRFSRSLRWEKRKCAD